jgi:hypothetical protein
MLQRHLYVNGVALKYYLCSVRATVPVPVAARSKMWVCGRSPAEILGSNPTKGMDVCCECCVLLCRGLCDELITRPEESYRLWCVVECDLETSWMRRLWPTGGGGLLHHKKGLLCLMNGLWAGLNNFNYLYCQTLFLFIMQAVKSLVRAGLLFIWLWITLMYYFQGFCQLNGRDGLGW